jgi:hypothetical protein
MGIFSIKSKVDMESFCKDYYDSQMFHAIVDGEDASQKILDAAYEQLAETDPSFSKVDRVLFDNEMTAMHLELFALAFYKRFNFDKAALHSVFTQRYLQNKDRMDIWAAMGNYGKVIAQTATINANGQLMTVDTAIERKTITRVKESRLGLYEKWLKTQLNDPENLTANEKEIASCVARVCNHVEADILRNNEVGNRRIAALFIYRLGAENIWGKKWRPSEDFLLGIASQPYSMYDSATQMLKTVGLRFP